MEQETSFLWRLRHVEIRLVISTAFVIEIMKNSDETQNDVCDLNADTTYSIQQERVWTEGGQLTTIGNNAMKAYRFKNAKFLRKRNNSIEKWCNMQE